MIPNVTLSVNESRAWRPGVEGGDWSDGVMAWYHALIPTLRPGAWLAEIGVAYGRSLLYAAELLSARRDGSLIIGVDPWQGMTHPDPDSRSPCSFSQAIQSFARWGRPHEMEIVYLLRAQSVKAAAAMDEGRLDGVMIDGNHSREAVAADIGAWRSKVRPGGFLAGHDYEDRFPGVRQAVDEAFPDGVELRGTVWVIEVQPEEEADQSPHSPPSPPAAPSSQTPPPGRRRGRANGGSA